MRYAPRVIRRGSLTRSLPQRGQDEVVEPLVGGASVRVERIVSHGHACPPGYWYDQDESEYVLVVEGCARLQLEGHGEFDLGPGDWIDIPAHQRHRVVWTTPEVATVWLAVFYPSTPPAPSHEPSANRGTASR
jgi:cupin 2 domain-containing protein